MLCRDCIFGMDASAHLSPQLISHLHSLNILYLYQIKESSRSEHQPDSWISSASLGLNPVLTGEWNNFRLALTHLGIRLTGTEDQLHWSGGDRSGKLTAQNVYFAIFNTLWHINITGWKKRSWTRRILLKVKLFTWLLSEYKLNTWDTLQKKGRAGPSFCHLCRINLKTTNHLFIDCSFTRRVWQKKLL